MKLVLSICALLGSSAACWASPNMWESHFEARMSVISGHVATATTGGVLLLGDSNTEFFWWNQNGGCRIINAGMAGARIADIAKRATTIANQTIPAIVHVMLGTNNLYIPPEDPEQADIATDLATIINAFKAKGSKVVMWPIPPLASNIPQAAGRSAINTAIQQAAAAANVSWDWWWPEQITGANGYAMAGALLGDGVHLSASSQASRYYRIETWRSYLGATCP